MFRGHGNLTRIYFATNIYGIQPTGAKTRNDLF